MFKHLNSFRMHGAKAYMDERTKANTTFSPPPLTNYQIRKQPVSNMTPTLPLPQQSPCPRWAAEALQMHREGLAAWPTWTHTRLCRCRGVPVTWSVFSDSVRTDSWKSTRYLGTLQHTSKYFILDEIKMKTHDSKRASGCPDCSEQGFTAAHMLENNRALKWTTSYFYLEKSRNEDQSRNLQHKKPVKG